MSAVETKDGVTLSIFVKPNSPKFKIELDGGEVVVYSTEEPDQRQSKQGNHKGSRETFRV